jgi:ATP-dependent exoDNAse (exonuclease V) alpha subunit
MSSKGKLNEEQKEAFNAIRKFVDHPAADIFVLKGYAGTGKTYLMQHLGRWLRENEYDFSMLASTGRAATVLRGKTGFDVRTVHGELYRFSKVEGDEEDIPDDAPIDKYGQMTLQFSLRPPDEGKKIYIIDEASMLSSEISPSSDTVLFGSGCLLVDFFDAANNNKIIFVGDPGQLPPVGQDFSPALDMNWLSEQKRTAVSVTLEKIERHGPENGILSLASAIRSMADPQRPLVKFPKLPARGVSNIRLHASHDSLLQDYLNRFKEIGTNGVLAVVRSNRMVNEINLAVRNHLYGTVDMSIQPGEILMVVQNNYSVPMTNGDFVVVTEIGETRLQANLHFQSIRVKALLSENEYEILLSLDVLVSQDANFSKAQSKQLMVDFSRRMRKKNCKPNSPKYKEAMMKDPYLNCLKAKFGYAVTCHKAQGGEWDEVYLFLEKSMYGMPHPELFRWWYTAVTRARKQLHLADDWWIV